MIDCRRCRWRYIHDKVDNCYSSSAQIVQLILAHLDGQSLLRIAGVSRWWRDVSEDEHVWHTLCARLNIDTSRQIGRMRYTLQSPSVSSTRRINVLRACTLFAHQRQCTCAINAHPCFGAVDKWSCTLMKWVSGATKQLETDAIETRIQLILQFLKNVDTVGFMQNFL